MRYQDVVIRGKTSFAKLLGEPVLNKFTNEREWTVDIEISEDTVRQFRQLGINDKVKSKPTYLDGRPYVSFKQKEFRTDNNTGERIANRPVEIVDINDKPWDGSLLGNGTIVDVKFRVGGNGPRKGAYLSKLRVLSHVPYEKKGDFPPITPDDEFFKNAGKAANEAAKKQDELDDEIPF
ncbi:hypothetical protein KGP36_03130 [Patescibacteria group bacterium]|nr:hypothetical protein [Patescibacteria group bacterium]